MNRVALMISFAASLSLIACESAPPHLDEATTPTPATTGVDLAAEASAPLYPKPMLPAFPSEAELKLGKADWYSDFKNSQPSVYAITASPATPVIPASEWDTKKALVVSWTGSFPDVVAGIISYANPVTDVWVVHDGASAKNGFLGQMAAYGVSTSGVKYLNEANDSIWIRDFGPISAFDADTGAVALVDPRYYENRVYDDAIPSALGADWGLNTFRMPVDFEGGNFMSDGRGTCFVSQGVLWFNGTSESMIRQYFREYLGCYQLVILSPLDGEGTTHIDMFSKQVDDDTILLGKYTTWQDATNKSIMDLNAEQLEAVVLADNVPLEVVRMPMPSNADGAFRTYINSQFINGINLIPVYTDDTGFEAEAMTLWEDVLPGFNHVALDATQLIQWSGAIHCILMEVQDGTWSPFQSGPSNICGSYDCYPSSGLGNAGCGSTAVLGSCKNGVASWCDFGEVQTDDCGASGETCTWLAGAGHYGCVSGEGCTSDCGGKTCGNDGCGGSCGSCDGDEICVAGSCEETTSGCGDITGVGCCDGATLTYCNNTGNLSTINCSTGCGWNASSDWYDCGFTDADPSGAWPLSCEPEVCTADCAGKGCGPDGCGGTCGMCETGEICTSAGQCTADPTACGDIEYAGCCDGDTLKFCNGGSLEQYACTGGCGWDDLSSWYDCGESGADPSGVYPLTCPGGSCAPECEGKACGDDGCGGVCGTCGDGTLCEGGQCVEICAPSCGGKTCGADGCGGVCGVCGEDSYCTMAGSCEALPTSGCGEISYEGLCTDGVIIYCSEDTLYGATCQSGCCGWNDATGYDCVEQSSCGTCADACEAGAVGCSMGGTHAWSCVIDGATGCRDRVYTACADGCDGDTGWCVDQCIPSCGTSACGDDGCGGSCGSCGYDEICEAGVCKSLCTPSCGSNVCGDDGCGGSCGSCGADEICEAGACVSVCAPACDGKMCGDDGCGGSCGTCAAGEICDAGLCLVSCLPSCDGKACGDDGCGGSCGSCAVGETCDEGQCVTLCVAQCADMECGDDGCGGSCGACAVGESCQAGQCVAGCEAQCVGKECGDDGCGGLCGLCAEGAECDASGICVVATCNPSCVGFECGDDGCGGSCGTCVEGEACELGRCVEGDPSGDPGVDPGPGDPGADPTRPGGVVTDGGAASDGCQGSPAGPSAGLIALLMWGLLALRRRAL